jgi:hypothetical protein
MCDGGQEKRPYKTRFRCNFAHHKSHMKYSHIEAVTMEATRAAADFHWTTQH